MQMQSNARKKSATQIKIFRVKKMDRNHWFISWKKVFACFMQKTNVQLCDHKPRRFFGVWSQQDTLNIPARRELVNASIVCRHTVIRGIKIHKLRLRTPKKMKKIPLTSREIARIFSLEQHSTLCSWDWELHWWQLRNETQVHRLFACPSYVRIWIAPC